MKNKADAAPWAPRPFGPKWARIVGLVLVKTLWRVQVTGQENVCAAGPIIVAGNHTALLDGPLLIGVTPRPAHFLVKGSLFSGPLGVILRGAGQIPVTKEKGRGALTAAQTVLERGGALGIFPEGTRGAGDLSQIHPGVGWLAAHTQTPIVPVAILGTRTDGKSVKSLPRLRSKIVVHFGVPVTPQPTETPGRRDVIAATEQVRQALIETITQTSSASGISLPQDPPKRETN